MFRTIYDHEKRRYHCSSGSHLLDEHVLAFDDLGIGYLKPVGKINIYKKIQSHRDSCDMHLIESKLDPKMLSNALSSFRVEDIDQSMINDLSCVPVSLGDALNTVKAAENLFNGLPLSVRKEFNFSSSAFIKASGSPKFNEIFHKAMTTASAAVPVAPTVAVPVASTAAVPVAPTVAVPVASTAAVPVAPTVAVPVKPKKKKIVEIEVDDDE